MKWIKDIGNWVVNHWIEIALICIAVGVTWLSPVASAIMFTMWYWVGEGATEGYTWSTSERRHGNYIIRPGIHDSPLFKTAQGRWCYHTWRVMGENVGMFGSVIMYVWLAHQGYALQGLLFDYMGATMAGIFFYERVFNHISYNDLWPQKSSWDVLNGWIIVPRAVWQDFVLLIVGIAFVVL